MCELPPMALKKQKSHVLPLSAYPWLKYPIFLILVHRVQWADQGKVIIVTKDFKVLSISCT